MKAGSEPEIAMPYNTGYEVDAENSRYHITIVMMQHL